MAEGAKQDVHLCKETVLSDYGFTARELSPI